MKRSLIYEKIINHKNSNYTLLDYLNIHHIKIDFRIHQHDSGLLLLILNLCILEKIFGSYHMLVKQKKNIRKFAPANSVIGGSFFIKPSKTFVTDFIFFYTSKKNFFFFKKKKNLNTFSKYNNLIYLNFSLSDFISFSEFTLSKNNWETLSYLYDKQIYGLDVSIALNTRFYLFNKLLLSSYGVNLVEINE